MRIGRARLTLQSEEGVTLVELMVTMGVFAIASVVFLSTLATVQKAVSREQHYTTSNDQARLAIENLDRVVRSGNVLYAPSSNGSSIVIYTQSNAPTFKATVNGSVYSGNRCVQWRVNGQNLETRSWRSQYVGDWSGAVGSQNVSAWRVAATGIVNYVVPAPVDAFKIDPDPLKGNRVMTVVLLVNDYYSVRPSQTISIQVSMTGRNTSYGFLSGACSPAPL